MMSTRWRYWPAVLAILSVALFFGTYLYFTEKLVTAIREEARVHGAVYASAYRGLISPDPTAEVESLRDIQLELGTLGLPVVLMSHQPGFPASAENLPFPTDDPSDPATQARIREYANVLARQGNIIEEPGFYTVYIGRPPILLWLRWIPWLQVGGAFTLALIAFAIVRSNMRAERERTWGAMARELAHQMGTPLSSLSGWVELLELPPEERVGMPGQEQVARELASDVERLERVSRRFELIGKAPALEPIPVAAVFADVERYIRPRLPRLGTGVELRVRVREDLPPIHANGVLLSWALENLVKNAMDALAGRGGRIFVAAIAMDGRFVRIQVADDGPGIEPGIRRRIFEAGVSTKTAGWGVGLSLVRRIVEDYHHGRISVRPRRSGGTVFELRIPVADER